MDSSEYKAEDHPGKHGAVYHQTVQFADVRAMFFNSCLVSTTQRPGLRSTSGKRRSPALVAWKLAYKNWKAAAAALTMSQHQAPLMGPLAKRDFQLRSGAPQTTTGQWKRREDRWQTECASFEELD